MNPRYRLLAHAWEAVYAAEFTLEGTVKGDLIVAGELIVIKGTVEGDLIAAGNTVVINRATFHVLVFVIKQRPHQINSFYIV
ncbi:MAG: hypothetical protein HGA19_23945, partial [Oscillochloris sp.]|nr:hypothetical protein [Oscillochloris sp.]